MKKIPDILFVLLVASLACSCASHTVLSGWTYPGKIPGTWVQEAWDTAPSRLYVSMHGASWHQYPERTVKTAVVEVERRGQGSFRGKYQMTGADIRWDAEWQDAGRVVIVRFYDMPDGQSAYQADWKQLRRQVLALRFVYDEQLSAFVEAQRE